MKPRIDISALVRPAVLAMKPYSSARDEFRGEARIWLDANENPYGAAASRYPDAQYVQLRQAIAAAKGCSPEQVLPGNGSDELIDLLMRTFCRPGIDEVVVQPPTYGMYAVQAAINDLAVREAPLTRRFLPDLRAIEAATTPFSRLIFFCSPNNPTGNRMPAETIRVVASAFSGLVVVDEAYIDFSGGSLLAQLADLPNLVVLQTFSKAWAKAGIRLGALFASPEIIRYIRKIKPPYNVSSLTGQAALRALQDPRRVARDIAEIRAERDGLAAWLEVQPLVREVFPSEANFLLVRFRDAAMIYRALLKRGIVLRDRSGLHGCKNCLRITIGTPDENAALKAALNDILYQNSAIRTLS